MHATNTYIFNPEHDLSMAYGCEGYTAPPRAQLLRRDLQLLPAWYCPDGADILSQNMEEDNRWLGQMEQLLGIKAQAIRINRLQCRHSSYHPWGWDLDLRQRLLNACVTPADLPSRDSVLRVQELSHRRTSITVHRRLAEMLGTTLSPIPVEVRSVEQICQFDMQHPQCFIKAPWSGSGKGIYRVLDAYNRSFITWAQGIINRQGSIMCEQPLDKVLDFAMEYRCCNGTATFAGYSVFINDSHCSYDSGIVASQERLEPIITTHLGDERLLHTVRQALCEILTEMVAPHYDGYLGIDMMVYRDDNGTMRLNPCVELNLRMTMGVVSSIIAERHLSAGSTATFRVAYFKQHDEMQAFITNEQRKAPLLIDKYKLVSGFMPLTPIYGDSKFLAYMSFEPHKDSLPRKFLAI